MTTLGALTFPCTEAEASQLRALVGVDLPVHPPADDDRPAVDVALHLAGGRDGHAPVDPDVALEPPVDQDVLVSGDLAHEARPRRR